MTNETKRNVGTECFCFFLEEGTEGELWNEMTKRKEKLTRASNSLTKRKSKSKQSPVFKRNCEQKKKKVFFLLLMETLCSIAWEEKGREI